MQVTMQHAERLTLSEMQEFLGASNTLNFAGTGPRADLRPARRRLVHPKVPGSAEKDKGIVRLYLVKIRGLRVAQARAARPVRLSRMPRRHSKDH